MRTESEKDKDSGCIMAIFLGLIGVAFGIYLGKEVIKPKQAAETAAQCALYFRSAGETETDTLRVLVVHDECKHFYRNRP